MKVAKRKTCKRCDHNIKLIEEIKNNIRQSNFEALVLTLYCYCGDNVKYRLLSKNLFQKKQQHGG